MPAGSWRKNRSRHMWSHVRGLHWGWHSCTGCTGPYFSVLIGFLVGLAHVTLPVPGSLTARGRGQGGRSRGGGMRGGVGGGLRGGGAGRWRTVWLWDNETQWNLLSASARKVLVSL